MKVEKLEDVCLISRGKTITKASSVEGDVPVIGGGLGPTYYHNIANVKPPVITISASGANAGFVNIWVEPIWASDCSTIIEKAGSPALIRYIFKFLQSSQEFINSKLRKGSAQPHVYSSDIGQLRIPLPSINEQKQIVEKLDKAFAEIDSLEKNLQIKEEKTNQLQQSILSAAFINREDFDVKVTKLGEVCNLIGGGTPSKANQDFYLGDINWATVRDLNKRWLEKTEHRINKKAVQESSTNIIPSGNVVIATRVGLGKVVQLAHETAINQDLRALVPKKDGTLNSNYLFYWAISISSKIMAAGKGATVQGVTLPFLENLEILLPSLEKQEVIVNRLDKAFSEIDKLKNQIFIEKELMSSLRQSILSNAFNFEEKAA